MIGYDSALLNTIVYGEGRAPAIIFSRSRRDVINELENIFLAEIVFILFSSFMPSFIILALLSSSLPPVTKIRGHIAGPPAPFPP